MTRRDKAAGHQGRDKEKVGCSIHPAATIICANPKCKHVFTPNDKRQKYCCARCRQIVAERKYNAKPSSKTARKNRDHMRYLDPIIRKGMKSLHEMWLFDQQERLATDAAYYAKIRMKRREIRRRQNDKHRKIAYRPCVSRRIPDTYCKGELMIDTRSQFFELNLTDSQRAFSRDLAIERKEFRVKPNIM